VNMVGGQDDLVFDGGSFVLDGDGSVLLEGPRFRTGELAVDLALPTAAPDAATPLDVVQLSDATERTDHLDTPVDLADRGTTPASPIKRPSAFSTTAQRPRPLSAWLATLRASQAAASSGV